MKNHFLEVKQTAAKDSDTVIKPGLSIHFIGETVGIYCHRMQCGKGFAEMPVSDLRALIDYFCSADQTAMLERN